MIMKKNKLDSLKLNGIMNMILTVSSFVFPLITFPYASRILMPAGIGKVSFALSLISYFSIFAQLGIPTYGIRACAKVRDDKIELTRVTHELLAINMITNAISYTCLFIALIYVKKLNDDRVLYIVIGSTIFLTSVGMEWLYKGLEQYIYITIRSIVFKLISLVGLFLLVHKESDYVIYGAITIFASSASNIVNFISIRKFVYFKYVGNYNLKRHFKAVITFFAMACATTIYTNLDTVMLGFMKTDTDVGYYNAGIKIKNILVSIVTSLGAVLLPRSSYYIETGKMKEFKSISIKALRFVFFASIPFMIYFIIFSREGIFFLSGPAFESSIRPMQILMPTVPIIGITNILGIQMLVPLGKEKLVLYSEIIGAAVDLTLNMILIPYYGTIGAAVGTLAAELSVLVFQIIVIRKIIDGLAICFGIKKYLLISAICAAICAWFKLLNLSFFIKLMCSSICFFAIYIFMLYITHDEMIGEVILKYHKKIRRRSDRNR